MDKTGQTIGSCIATAVTRTHVLTSAACLKDNNGQNRTKKFTFKKPDESINILDFTLSSPCNQLWLLPPNPSPSEFFRKLSHLGILSFILLSRLKLSNYFSHHFLVGKILVLCLPKVLAKKIQ